MMNTQAGRVIVGIGRSAGAYQALRYAMVEARRRSAALIAVRAFRPPHNGMGELSTEFHVRGAFAQVDIAVAEALGGWPEDLQVKIVVREGSTAHSLVAIADREADLLVIGGCGVRRLTHGRSTTVARFCAREATCPVVIVPPSVLARSARADRLARDITRDIDDYLCRHGPIDAHPPHLT
jgi:nucleotide-binding universal stress UspA family protein